MIYWEGYMCRHKKIILLVCVLLTAFNLVACGQVKENETTNEGETVVNQQESNMQAEKTVYQIPLFPLGIMIYMAMTEPVWFIFSRKWNSGTERIFRFMKMG